MGAGRARARVHDPAASPTTATCWRPRATPASSPWVCLHHFTLPRWFPATGGFLVEANRTEVWRRHVDFVAETFGDLVGGWQPVNETNYYARAAYRGGAGRPVTTTVTRRPSSTRRSTWPPPRRRCACAQTGAPVASIFGLSPIVAQDDEPATASMARAPVRHLLGAGLGLFRDGVLRVPGRDAGRAARPGRRLRPDRLLVLRAMGVATGDEGPPAGRPVSPLGYGIWADGVGPGARPPPWRGARHAAARRRVRHRHRRRRRPGGLPDRGLEVVHDAIDRGIDVRGLFHWTGVDNYEWLHGFDVAFGIIDRDRNVRASALVLGQKARA